MPRSTPLLAFTLGLLLGGCSSDILSKISGKGDDSGGEDAEDTQGDTPQDVSGSYLTDLACGPETNPPEGVAAAGESAFGCSLLPVDSDIRHKILTPLADAKVRVVLTDGREGYPPLVVAAAVSRWHVLFGLPTGVTTSVRKVVMTADDPTLKLKGVSGLSSMPDELTPAEAAEAVAVTVDNSAASRITEDGDGLVIPPADDGGDGSDANDGGTTDGSDGADGGGGDGGSPPASSHVAFITSRNFTVGTAYQVGSIVGDKGVYFNAVEQTDVICTELASKANLTATGWKGIISSSASAAKDRIKVTGPIYDVMGGLIVDAVPFWGNPGVPTFRINMMETGVTTTGVAWTGTYDDGSSSSTNCQDWSSSTIGMVGTASPTAPNQWISSQGHSCLLDAKLYCISGQ